ncbi:MAG TPA: serine hydrolase [Jatrophihabitans sp.]|nr:serine hydrolase [Jatrophihabitans sp.]
MRHRVVAALVALTICGTGVLLGLPATGAPTSRNVLPPPAPKPTDSGGSPSAPDPHPPLGGIGPDGEAVGGPALLARGLILPAGAQPLPRNVTARAWIVVDLDSGAVIGARDPHGRYQPASIQKLLTTVTLLPRLPGGRTVTVSKAAARTEGSHAGLVAGGRYTVDQLFRGLLLVSGNDAAEALAEAAGGRARTVRLMNAQAVRLGAYDTFVQTPSGLDGWKQLTSAYDMALILRAALGQPRFVAYDTTVQATLPRQQVNSLGPVRMYNQNELFLTTVRGALAAKTGFTDAAQHTFVGAIRRGGHRYGVVLLRAQRWPLDQWQQAAALVGWARRLPKGTAPVGRLVSAHDGVAAANGATAPHRRAAEQHATKHHDASQTAWSVLALVVIVLLFAGGSVLVRRYATGRPLRAPRP